MDTSMDPNIITYVWTGVFCWFTTCILQKRGMQVAASGPRGHLKPLGSHRHPEVPLDVLTQFPHPSVFYERYAEPGRPFLVKHGAKQIPAYKLWTDEYLSDKYGDLECDVELGKKENRSKRTDVLPLRKFLSLYQEEDVYMVQDMPKEMMGEFAVPRSLLCGGFVNGLQTVVMWFSSGGTKSVLHNDDIDNINCILEGNKDLFLIDKKHEHLVEANGWSVDGSYHELDVEKVDILKYPNFENMPWYSANMARSDCFFIPKRWYHQVTSSTDTNRNFAVNLWFSNLPHFNKTDCDLKVQLPEFELLNRLSLSHPSEVFRYDILMLFKNGDNFTIEEVQTILKHSTKEDINTFVKHADGNNDSVLSWEELYAFDVNAVLKAAPSVDPNVQDDISEESEENGDHDEL